MRRGLTIALATLGASLALAPAAGANFHLMKIREVATNPAGTQSAFIELQMYAAGQNATAGHPLNFYTADGSLSTTLPLTNVPNGDNQRTILIGDTGVAGRDIAYDVLWEAVSTLGSGGAACFDTIDCVSWGAFTGAATLPSPPGAPAPAITDGSSLERSIAPGCATLLEASDDTGSSAADFALAAPSPRSNSVAPTETACGGGGRHGPARDDDHQVAEEASRLRPGRRSSSSRASRDRPSCASSTRGSTRAAPPRSSSGSTSASTSSRSFAVDQAGNADRSPAKAKFKRIEG